MAIEGKGFIPRQDFMIFAEVGNGSTPAWELIGERIEELRVTMGANVETITDIRGYTETTLDRYQMQTEVTPMRAKRDSKLFGVLYDIVKNEKTLSDVERDFLCVTVFDSSKEGEGENEKLYYTAWKQRGVVAVESFGGGTAGLEIPFTIHWVGGKVHGRFDSKTREFVQ